MSDNKNNDSYIHKLIDYNERLYGKEIRAKYGNDVIDLSYAKLKGTTAEQRAENERLENAYKSVLKEAFEAGSPDSELAQKACALHKEWLCYFWPKYNKDAHVFVVRMYVDDPRFKKYYDKIAPGCAAFFYEAIKIFCS